MCLLEVMKTFHRISYGGAGLPKKAKISAVVPGDGADVEVGDALLRLEGARRVDSTERVVEALAARQVQHGQMLDSSVVLEPHNPQYRRCSSSRRRLERNLFACADASRDDFVGRVPPWGFAVVGVFLSGWTIGGKVMTEEKADVPAKQKEKREEELSDEVLDKVSGGVVTTPPQPTPPPDKVKTS